MIVLALIVGILIPSVELIIGLVGSTIGVAICIMFPASCIIKIGKKNSTEKLLAQLILVFGFFLMILGTYANLSAIDEKSSRPTYIVDEPVMQKIDLPTNLTDSIEVPRLDDDRQRPIVKEINLFESKVHNSVELAKAETNIEDKKDADESPNLSGANESKKENNINREAIMREDQEIAIDEQEQSDVKVEINRLEKTKNLLIQQVQEIKEDLKKQNEVTQNKVLQKFDEIAGKVDHIEKAQAQLEEQKKETFVQKTADSDGILAKNQAVDVLTATKNITQPAVNFKPAIPDNPVVNLLIKNQVLSSAIARIADAKNETILPEKPSDDNKSVVDLPISLNSSIVEPVPDTVIKPETLAKIDLEVHKVDVTEPPLIPSAEKIPYSEKVGRDILNLFEKTANVTVRDKRNAADEENCAETTTKKPIDDLEAPVLVESNRHSEPQIANSVAAVRVLDDSNVAYGRDLKSVEDAYTVSSSDL